MKYWIQFPYSKEELISFYKLCRVDPPMSYLDSIVSEGRKYLGLKARYEPCVHHMIFGYVQHPKEVIDYTLVNNNKIIYLYL